MTKDNKAAAVLREIGSDEVQCLVPLITELAAHHNQVSANFKGFYPRRPFEETLRLFTKDLSGGLSRIAVIEVSDRPAAFCKLDIQPDQGKIDYLVVDKKYRGKRYGERLMEWAMDVFREKAVSKVEVKVVDGNEAIRFYE